jgi:hypothetical protein
LYLLSVWENAQELNAAALKLINSARIRDVMAIIQSPRHKSVKFTAGQLFPTAASIAPACRIARTLPLTVGHYLGLRSLHRQANAASDVRLPPRPCENSPRRKSRAKSYRSDACVRSSFPVLGRPGSASGKLLRRKFRELSFHTASTPCGHSLRPFPGTPAP